jgi:HSP20 family molecular chaperone IbpA
MADKPIDQAQDISKLVDQSVNTLQEVDRRLQMVRNDLANLIARASQLQMQAIPGGLQALPGVPSLGGVLGVEAIGRQAQAFPPFGYGLAATGAMPFSPGLSPATAASTAQPFTGLPPGAGFQGQANTAPTQQGFSGAGSILGRSTKELQNAPPMPRVPSADLIDQGNEYVIQLEMPGVKKEDLDIMVSERTVTISGAVKPDVGEGTLLLAERGPVIYRRMLPLPSEVHTTQSKAQFKDGILTLTVPKKVPTEGPRRIDVGYS